jgi:hypothetical protein
VSIWTMIRHVSDTDTPNPKSVRILYFMASWVYNTHGNKGQRRNGAYVVVLERFVFLSLLRPFFKSTICCMNQCIWTFLCESLHSCTHSRINLWHLTILFVHPFIFLFHFHIASKHVFVKQFIHLYRYECVCFSFKKMNFFVVFFKIDFVKSFFKIL